LFFAKNIIVGLKKMLFRLCASQTFLEQIAAADGTSFFRRQTATVRRELTKRVPYGPRCADHMALFSFLPDEYRADAMPYRCRPYGRRGFVGMLYEKHNRPKAARCSFYEPEKMLKVTFYPKMHNCEERNSRLVPRGTIF
jgi:hypothetical protein